jgi:hypothetical protein
MKIFSTIPLIFIDAFCAPRTNRCRRNCTTGPTTHLCSKCIFCGFPYEQACNKSPRICDSIHKCSPNPCKERWAGRSKITRVCNNCSTVIRIPACPRSRLAAVGKGIARTCGRCPTTATALGTTATAAPAAIDTALIALTTLRRRSAMKRLAAALAGVSVPGGALLRSL